MRIRTGQMIQYSLPAKGILADEELDAVIGG